MSDLDTLTGACVHLVSNMDWARTFSVQTRLFEDGWPYTRYDANKRLSEKLMEEGSVLDVRRPEQIISVVLTPALRFLGLSFAVDNLSDWAGGARHFRREEGQVSRAEFKLLEALELFALSLPAQGLALDLGAAPGGWTRILRKHAMRVVAVDPGDLDGRLATDGAIRHVRQTAQAYLRTSSERFNVILNDMRMDARASAQLTVAAARSLEPSGWALVTLKLPKRAASGAVASALSILRRRYDVIGARQLFHNRSEATVALRQVGSS